MLSRIRCCAQNARRALARQMLAAMLLAFVALAMGGCLFTPNQAPLPALHAEPLTGTPPLHVELDASGSTDSDGIVIAYRWSFGDGTGGVGLDADHTYHAAGTYTIQLTIEDNDGGEAVQSVDVVVQSPNSSPTATFAYSPSSATLATPVQFDATASMDPDGSIISYAWDFGDGAVGAGQFAEHTFAQPGLHAVTLTVTDNRGAARQQTLNVLVLDDPQQVPVARFAPATVSIDVGDIVQLDASSSTAPTGDIAHYEWTFGDGTAASGMTVAHTYQVAGTYAVTLSVVDTAGRTARTTGTVAVEGTTEPVPPPPTPAPGDETLTRTFSWTYEGRTRRLSVSVSQSLVDGYESKAHATWPNHNYADYILNSVDDDILWGVIQSIRFDCYFRTIKNVLAFVQMGIADQTGAPAFEHPQFPVETLVNGTGDSEDTAILYASLIRTYGYRALLAAVDTDGDSVSDRMVVLVPVGTSYSKYGIPEAWKYGGTVYAVANTGADGGASPLGTDPWDLRPEDFKMVWDASRLNAYPLLTEY